MGAKSYTFIRSARVQGIQIRHAGRSDRPWNLRATLGASECNWHGRLSGADTNEVPLLYLVASGPRIPIGFRIKLLDSSCGYPKLLGNAGTGISALDNIGRAKTIVAN